MSDIIKTAYADLQDLEEMLSRALPASAMSDRFLMAAFSEIRKKPDLAEAPRAELIQALLKIAQYGLELGIEVHLSSYKTKHGDIKVEFIIEYGGLVSLICRSGAFHSAYAREVHEKDHFVYELGTAAKLSHRLSTADRAEGQITHFYAMAIPANGSPAIHVMTAAEINRIRDKYAKRITSEHSAWHEEYARMGSKTVLRQLINYLPHNLGHHPTYATPTGAEFESSAPINSTNGDGNGKT